ncbi:hypothetical protein EJ05DRAFT_63774 [Pseudovirgaria hyperparasitica]|uniref:Integral membrane protein-like protein n=1 Tax=Pseudovirgaria hyperparasitica TaxID=470096 RepID=A0A6A6W0F1_9PEZI|nr:uncharacterized protein EJ05DRAFT_63774 [Pseudovirgaria hyperparasitica]KAF2756382.1 hypothetical protein EJ05DRAFT_63774 [Pseudovirgaria hyperparasitica]
MIRIFAIIPALLSAGALVISFLCLFAGNKPGFMEDFNLFNLNTSRIGSTLAENALNGENSILPSSITNILNELPEDVRNSIESIASTAADSFAQDLGLDDFYSAHMLNYCAGDYLPNAIPNATVSEDDIYKNVTVCSSPRSSYWFDPRDALQDSLDRANVTTITVDQLLEQLNFPNEIITALDALRIAYRAMFTLYVVTICLCFIMFVISAIYIFTHGSRITACVVIIISLLTFVASGAASGVATAVNVIGANAINQYGDQVGIEADMGRKFLALTWAGTAAVFIGLLYWFVDCCCGRSRKSTRYDTYEK